MLTTVFAYVWYLISKAYQSFISLFRDDDPFDDDWDKYCSEVI